MGGARSKRAQELRKAKKAAEPADPSVVALHRGRFVDWSPSPIVCSAAASDGSVVSIGREDGSIELWDTSSWHCFKSIPGRENAAISALAWVQDSLDGRFRLFSAGLEGQLTEWDTQRLTPAAAADSCGGAVWALAVQPGTREDGSAQLAAGCDDGTVRLFTMEPGVLGLQYRRALGRTEARVLSVAWHPQGEALYAGSSDGCIRAWHAGSGREALRITAGSGSGGENCIWALLVLPDGSPVSGDSRGNVQVWDGRFGTLLQGFQQHCAPVLALAASPAGDTLFASGVDVQLAIFYRLQENAGPQRWVYLQAKRPHSHDVRMLAVVTPPRSEPLLLSGGNDAQLLLHSVARYTKEHPRRVDPVPQRPLLDTAPAPQPSAAASSPAPPLLLAAQRTSIDLWHLGVAARRNQQGAGTSGRPAVEAGPVQLLRIGKRGDQHCLAAALAPNGTALAFSDCAQLRILDLHHHPQHGYSAKRRKLSKDVPAAHHLAFTADSERLLVAVPDGSLALLDAGTGSRIATFTEARPPAATARNGLALSTPLKQRSAVEQLRAAVTMVGVSPCGSWAAAATPRHVHLFNLHKLQHHGRLPPLPDATPVAALEFTGNGAVLVVATAGRSIAVYDVASCQLSPWMQDNREKLAARLQHLPGPLLCVSFNPFPQQQTLVVATTGAFAYFDLLRPLSELPSRKRKRTREKPTDTVSVTEGDNFRAAKLDHPPLFLRFSGPSAAILLERPWEEVWRGLPAPMYRHRYGT